MVVWLLFAFVTLYAIAANVLHITSNRFPDAELYILIIGLAAVVTHEIKQHISLSSSNHSRELDEMKARISKLDLELQEQLRRHDV
jgi:hypothetical protein